MSQNDLFDSAPKSEVKETKSRSRLGVMATALLGGSLVALYAVAAPFVTPALRKVCLPFVPATTAQVENVLRVLQSRTGTLVDIGSGDGRIVSTRSWTDGQIHRPRVVSRFAGPHHFILFLLPVWVFLVWKF